MTDQIDKDAQNTHELTRSMVAGVYCRGWRLTTAESCTGGNLAAAPVLRLDTAAFYDTSVVTFSGKAKRNDARVPRGNPGGNIALSAKRAFRNVDRYFVVSRSRYRHRHQRLWGEGGRMELPPGRYGLHGTFAARSKLQRMRFYR